MSQLASQMQTKMKTALDTLRTEQLVKMRKAGDAIKKLPNITGALDEINDHPVMSETDTSMAMGFALGTPGLDTIAGLVVDTAIQFREDHNAIKRPQDTQPITLKQEKIIREQINGHLAEFRAAEEKLDICNAALMSGDNIAHQCAETKRIFTKYDPEFVPQDSSERTYKPTQQWFPKQTHAGNSLSH